LGYELLEICEGETPPPAGRTQAGDIASVGPTAHGTEVDAQVACCVSQVEPDIRRWWGSQSIIPMYSDL
jgi:hypothetical protein